ncbi:DUF4174 domain-containing protein [Roseibacterium sp. SDUM158017]|uniref:DUF4174 domain-containing protein n=1 Tax=Roseicyclus salinarum TaxID=3036773 RepID=UPI0024154D86|nr:DUF4174 domain-containing protein [Roseibacterium sp. SDUM158017]MDG4650518.1 DUF4174 domain-containing protein [Roseibacterium sp. SDUM158017]
MRKTLVFAIAALLLAKTPLLAQASLPDTRRDGQAPLIDQTLVDPLRPLDAAEIDPDDLLWLARPLIVFAASSADPRVIEQLQLLAEQPGPLIEREVMVIVDTDPSARSPFRTELRPRGFSVVLITKSGSVGRRWPSPRDVREISIAIDNFSLRQDAVRTGE